MSKICPQCGLSCIDSAPFCSQCGCLFPQDGAAAPAQQPMYQQPMNPQQPVYQQPVNSQQPVYQQPVYQQPIYPQQIVKPSYKGMRGRGFAITSMVLGIIGVVIAFAGFSRMMSFGFADYETARIMITEASIFGVLALVFSIIALVRKFKRQAIAGLVLSIVTLLFVMSGFVLYII